MQILLVKALYCVIRAMDLLFHYCALLINCIFYKLK